MCENVSSDTNTYIGNLLFNLIAITSVFGNKYPYITGEVSIRKIEDTIAQKLVDTPIEDRNNKNLIFPITNRDPSNFYVDELLKFVDSLSFIQGIGQLFTICATKKSLQTAPGFIEFRDNLINTKYKGKLNNPLELANLEAECEKYDNEFLKDDPSNGKFLSGKIKKMGRKKTKLLIGSDVTFEQKTEVSPILTSLVEGMPIDNTSIVNMMNSARAGSHSRGIETIKGGTVAKTILRACTGIKLIDSDCGSKMGTFRTYTKLDYHKLVGRYIIINDLSILIENVNQAKEYINKQVIVRSPNYCKLIKEKFCYLCVGKNLSINPLGVASALNEVSAVFLATSMKAMHGKSLETIKIDINRAFS